LQNAETGPLKRNEEARYKKINGGRRWSGLWPARVVNIILFCLLVVAPFPVFLRLSLV
jgi:hypothetical protein